MKKYITERKYDKLFDSLSDGLGEKTLEGSKIFTPGNFDTWFERIMNTQDYQIIGVRYQIRRVAERIKAKRRDWRLNHLQLGKLVRHKEKGGLGAARVCNLSGDALWQLDRVLAAVIRDYLRAFIQKSPTVGNCVICDNPEGLSYHEASNGKNIDLYARRWSDLVNKVADEFDLIIQLKEKADSCDSEEYWEVRQTVAEKAFKDLAYIYSDLNW